MKKKVIALFALLTMQGCMAVRSEYEPEKVYRVTGGYATGSQKKGNEFLFALKAPMGEWRYHFRQSPLFDKTNFGYVAFYNPAGNKIDFRWHWSSKRDIASDAVSNPKSLPWYSGTEIQLGRTPEQPEDTRSDYRGCKGPACSRVLWRQFQLLGSNRYYCGSSLRRSWIPLFDDGNRKFPGRFSYDYIIYCPFRLLDGRNANLIVTSGFGITPEQLADNPDRPDENVAIIDRMLERTWDSLEVMPQAYQFEPPSAP